MAEGILLIDKAIGQSSFDVVRKIRAIAREKRIGHAGTLDPLASGLLIIALGRYTKLCGYLTSDYKQYEAIIELGKKTTTDDTEGEVLEQKPVDHLKPEEIISVVKHFTGEIFQVPPRFSAIKIGGKRAYALARKDEDFVIEKRRVDISNIEIKKIDLPFVHIKVRCSKGTYIRSLARDIGDLLQVGAHAHAIHRTSSGAYDITKAMKLTDLDENNINYCLMTGKEALLGMECVDINSIDRENAIHGRLLRHVLPIKKTCVAIFNDDPVAIIAPHEEAVRVLRVI